MSAPHELTQLHLDGRLPEGRRGAYEAHLRDCAECRALVTSWQQFSSSYREGTEPLLAPPPTKSVQELVRKGRQLSGERRSPTWVWGVVAAAAAAAVLAVVMLRRGPAEVPAVAIADGVETPLQGDEFEAPESKGAVLQVGADRLGVAQRSRVRLVRHDAKHVRVKLERGAIACAVSHKAKDQSFAVESGRVLVSVVGTRFRVAQEGAGVRVEVAEGHVRVASGDAHWDVLAGQVLAVDADKGAVSPFAAKDFSELAPGAETPDAGPVAAPEPEDAGVAEVEAEPGGPAQAPRPVDVERWRRAASGGRCAAVLPAIRRAVHAAPKQYDAWRVLADCLRLTGEYRESALAYRKVMSYAPPDEADRARLLLAELLHERLHSDAEAERLLDAYLRHPRLPPLEASARVMLARTLLSQGKKAQARAQLERVTKRLPSSPPALEALELLKQLDGR